MDKKNAVNLLNETFNNDFNNGNFFKFIKELFNEFSISQRDATKYISKEYSEYINSFLKIGDYKDDNGKEIEVLIVKLNKTSSRDRARTMQRNFIANWLGKTEKDAALVAFYGDDPKDWRFSFVKMEYNLIKDEKGKTKISKELTPAKRYSFLVGVNEPNHTCRRQFLELVMQDEINPSVEEIESAFSIDNVTKEFFDEYKELFLELEESLQKVVLRDKHVKEEFEVKGISTVDFAKKLLGQIVFIYFLQKKGWLGVKKGEKWGDGPKDFMRYLFGGGIRDYKPLVPYKNFFNEILEPLFYEALANDRSADDHFYRLFNCKIPFLNGGLFEPINDYKWAETDIVIDNAIFDKILTTFDRFNFTVKEDEPLEKEVAVDPEMLGKVFENLLEVKDRKSKGAFYTPREIVHYMCQQSLINYLETNTSIPRKDIGKFIQLGDLALDMIIKEQEQVKKYGRSYDIKEEYSLPKSIKENYKEIDKLLKEIKIVDPAVGSGAFPVGMMNEIIKARSILSMYFHEKRSDYDLKREIIENCLYGVDIESSAVDITKLRFWLSLIVDELDMQNIKPLPNLDHKIMCGNSLLEEFEGVKLFDEKLLGEIKRNYAGELSDINKKISELMQKKADEKQIKKLQKEYKNLEKESKEDKSSKQSTLGWDNRIKESQRKLSELKRLQKEFFNAENRNLKKQLREKIDKIEWEMIEETLKEQGNLEAMQKLEQYKKNKAKPFFLWKLYFAEVFQRDNPGFDVVIANPPYVSAWSMETDDPTMRDKIKSSLRDYTFLSGHWDLYIAFVARGDSLLRISGSLSYIVPNPILREKYATDTRRFFLEKMQLQSILEFNDINVFENVARRTSVIVSVKNQNKNYTIKICGNRQIHDGIIVLMNIVKMEDWLKNHNYQYLIKGNKEEDVLILNLETKSRKMGNFFYVNYGVQVSSKEKGKFGKKEVVGKNPKGNSKNFYEGKDVQRWHLRYRGLYLDYRETDLYGPRAPELFENDKIVIRKVSDKGHRISATLDSSKRYTDDGNVILIPYIKISNSKLNQNFRDYEIYESKLDMKYVLSILLSKLETFYFRKKFATESLQGSTSHTYPASVRGLLIKDIPPEQQKPFTQLVDQILSITKDDDYLDNPDKQAKVKKLEKEIDQLVYKLYELIPEEIKIVEEFSK